MALKEHLQPLEDMFQDLLRGGLDEDDWGSWKESVQQAAGEGDISEDEAASLIETHVGEAMAAIGQTGESEPADD
jgi:hypothetical protein